MYSCRSFAAVGLALVLLASFWPAAYASDFLEESAQAALQCGVPADIVDDLLDVVQRDGLDEHDVVTLLAVLTDACVEGLPLENLSDKVREGLVKGVPVVRIRMVVESMIDDLIYAKSLLGLREWSDGKVPGLFVESLATAFGLGYSRDDAQTLFASHPVVSAPMLVTAAELAALLRKVHFDPELGQGIVDAGLESQSLGQDWRSFPRTVELARARGADDERIAAAAVAALRANEPASQVMARLGFTSRDLRRAPGEPGN